MKIYLKVVLLLAFIGASIGIIGPFMISQQDTLMVLAGIAYLPLVFIPGVWYLGMSIYKDVVSKFFNQTRSN